MGKTTLINSIVGVTRYRGGALHLGGRDITKLPPNSAPMRASAGCRRSATSSAPSPWTKTSPRWRCPAHGRRNGSTRCFRGSASARPTSATSSRAASSRCWRSAARWCSIRKSCCSTSRWRARPHHRRGAAGRAHPHHPPRRHVSDPGGAKSQKILGVTDRAVILERGAIVHEADSATLRGDAAALESFLGVTDQGPRRGRAGLQFDTFLEATTAA